MRRRLRRSRRAHRPTPSSESELGKTQQTAGFVAAGGRAAVLAGRHSRQCDQLPPAEGRPRRGELLADRAIVLFGVQRAVFAHGVLQQQIEDRSRGVPQLETQLGNLEKEYRESGYDDIAYGAWTAGETRIGGRGIQQVAYALGMGGSPAGLKPTGVEFDLALGAMSLRQLAKAVVKRSLTRTPAKAPLGGRVREVHQALDRIAQSQRTTAILETTDGTRIVASGGRDLTPAQRAILGPSEMAAKSPHAHAEVTVLEHAACNGLRPAKISSSRPFCDECRKQIEQAGGRITSPTTAEFPR